ncbi:uncharacterized protein [Montipora foliosa]|uniref:uncharacterized protein isoform X2 n=1 Tax=Montipora foliosa TaxID=591990 RepID=UPI0035F19C1E
MDIRTKQKPSEKVATPLSKRGNCVLSSYEGSWTHQFQHQERTLTSQDSHVRRARKERVEVERTEHKCHKVNTCLDKYPREQLFNCTTVRRCMPPPARIHVHSLPGGMINSIITSWSTGGAGMSKNLTWLSHDPKLTYAIEFSADDYIKIIRGGIYFVYCNLRVASKYIEEVSIKMYHNGHEEILLSTSLNQNVSPVHDVKLYRQASIGSGAKLYVQVKRSSFDFKGIKYSATLRSSVLYGLFPYAFSLEKTQGNDNLGLFMIDKCDLS